MAKFTSNKVINTRWRNNDFVGAAGSSHTLPDAFYDEFLVDWAYQISLGDIVITETPTTGNIQVATLTVGDIVLTGTATGNFNAGGGTTVIGTSPISVATSGSTATVSLNANYQTAGTYVTSVTGTAPITASGTTAVTVGIDQTAITANSATNASVLRAYVKNSTGTTLNKGQVVYVSGADGANALISLSSASSEAGSSKTLGLLAQTLLTGEQGYVVENGLLVDIDTSAATAGQAVWLGNTPGSFVFGTPPAEPSHSVYLGVVTRVQSNNGEILVKVQNGYELDELHDVSVGSPTDGDIIQWKSSSSLWTKASIANAGIASSVHTHPYQPAGTYVTAVNGTAPITATTDTAGVVTVALTANYQPAGTYVTSVAGDAAISATGTTAITLAHTTTDGYRHVPATGTTNNGKYLKSGATAGSEAWSNIAQTDVTNLTADLAAKLSGSSGFATVGFASGTATTISSTTSTAPTDISGLTFTFTPTYDEDVRVVFNLVFTQSAAPTATVDIISRIILDGTIVSPQGGFTRLAANHSSPTGFTQGVSYTFAATSGVSYTVKCAAYKSAAQGTFTASNISSFSILRVRA